VIVTSLDAWFDESLAPRKGAFHIHGMTSEQKLPTEPVSERVLPVTPQDALTLKRARHMLTQFADALEGAVQEDRRTARLALRQVATNLEMMEGRVRALVYPRDDTP
jgi:hypothetical protein